MSMFAKIRSWLVGAAAGLLLALLILPATRGIFLVQLRLAAFQHNLLTDPGRIEVTAAKYPDDFQMQIAGAHSSYEQALAAIPPPVPIVKNSRNNGRVITSAAILEAADFVRLTPLRKLEDKFPNNPSVNANILRFLSGQQHVTTSRPENWIGNDLASEQITQPAPSKTYNEFYDRTAEIGERLDPNNAYFPMMRAVGLFGDYKDRLAIAEIHKAAQDTVWQEYDQDEVYGMWKVSDIQEGASVAMVHAEYSASVLFPQYAPLRGMARIALYKAMQAERSGDTASGISIRMDLIKCGSLMRAQSGVVIGSLVGMAISNISMSNVGGILKKYKDINNPGQPVVKATTLRMQDYCAYLRSHGYAALIPSITQEYENCLAVRKMLTSSNFADVELQGFVRSVEFLTVDISILAAISMLLLAAVLSAIALNRSTLLNLPLYVRLPASVVGITAGVALWIAATGPTGIPGYDQHVPYGFPNLPAVQLAELICDFVVVAAILSFGIVSAIRSRSFTLIYGAQLLAVATGVCAALYVVLEDAYPQNNRNAINYLEYIELIVSLLLVSLTLAQSLVSSVRSKSSSWRYYAIPLVKTLCGCAVGALVLQFAYFQIVRCYSVAQSSGYVLDDSASYSLKLFLCIGLGVLAPVLCIVLVSAFIGLKSRSSMAWSMVQGLGKASIPLASLLVLIYGGLLLYTIKQDAPDNNRSTHWMLDEGPSWAKFSGVGWPGAVEWPEDPKSIATRG